MSPQTRILTTVLFLDVVGSTDIASDLGDSGWQQLLRRFRTVVRERLRRYGGREVDTAGDGFLARFDRPADGVRAAAEITEAVRELGLEIRSGLHFGECELDGSNLSGIAVHTGARVMAAAGTGEVVVTATVKDLVAGANLEFEDRGEHPLKGVPGTWQLYGVAPVGETVEEEVAAERRRAAAEPPGRRRRTTALMAGLAVVGLAAIAVILIGSGDEPPPDRGPTTPYDALYRIDPATNEIVARVQPLPAVHPQGRFTDVVEGQGSLWVENSGRGTLIRVDPEANRVTSQITVGRLTFGVAVTEGVEAAVWVTASQDRLVGNPDLLRVDTTTEQVVEAIEVPVNRATAIPESPVIAGEGALWILDPANGFVRRVDPATNEITDEVELPTGIQSAFAVGEGGVWIGADLADVVYHLDPRTLDVTEVAVPGGVSELAVGEGSVWGVNSVDGTLTEIDPLTDTVERNTDAGGRPTGIAVGGGAVWITDRDGLVTRIDVATREKTLIEVAGVPEGVVVTDDAVWVAVRST